MVEKVVAEYNAQGIFFQSSEDPIRVTGVLSLCSDSKVVGYLTTNTSNPYEMVILGRHHHINDQGTLSLARLFTAQTPHPQHKDVPVKLILSHGAWLPDVTGSQGFNGFHSGKFMILPDSVLEAVYGRKYVPGSIEEFRTIPLEDISALTDNRQYIFEKNGVNELERVACANGHTITLTLKPKA